MQVDFRRGCRLLFRDARIGFVCIGFVNIGFVNTGFVNIRFVNIGFVNMGFVCIGFEKHGLLLSQYGWPVKRNVYHLYCTSCGQV